MLLWENESFPISNLRRCSPSLQVFLNSQFVFSDRRKVDKIDLDDTREYEVKTITSGLKNYFRWVDFRRYL